MAIALSAARATDLESDWQNWVLENAFGKYSERPAGISSEQSLVSDWSLGTGTGLQSLREAGNKKVGLYQESDAWS